MDDMEYAHIARKDTGSLDHLLYVLNVEVNWDREDDVNDYIAFVFEAYKELKEIMDKWQAHREPSSQNDTFSQTSTPTTTSTGT